MFWICMLRYMHIYIYNKIIIYYIYIMILFLSPSIVLSLRCANALNLMTRAQLRPQLSNCPANNLSFFDPHADQNHRDVHGWGPLSALWKHCLENVRRNPRNPQTILRRQWEQWRQSLDHLAEEDEHLGLVPDSFWLDHSTILYLRNSKKKLSWEMPAFLV